MATRAGVASRVDRNCARRDIIAAENSEEAYCAGGQRCAVNRAAICDGAGEGKLADAIVASCTCKAVVACICAAQGRANRFNASIGTRLQVTA